MIIMKSHQECGLQGSKRDHCQQQEEKQRPAHPYIAGSSKHSLVLGDQPTPRTAKQETPRVHSAPAHSVTTGLAAPNSLNQVN